VIQGMPTGQQVEVFSRMSNEKLVKVFKEMSLSGRVKAFKAMEPKGQDKILRVLPLEQLALVFEKLTERESSSGRENARRQESSNG
jgi:Mg/Co/Ni transporter MgtE